MNVANLENSKRLYEVSGWDNTEKYWNSDYPDKPLSNYRPIATSKTPARRFSDWVCPAYDTGYLLRKLPIRIKDEYQFNQFGARLKQTGGSGWVAWYGEIGKDSETGFSSADTPEDCLALLAIKLIEEGIIDGNKNN